MYGTPIANGSYCCPGKNRFTGTLSCAMTADILSGADRQNFRSKRLTGALLDRITHHVHIIEVNGDSYRLKQSSRTAVISS